MVEPATRSARERHAVVVLDARADGGGRVERLEVDISLFKDTTVRAVMDDILQALQEMHLTLLFPSESAVLVWRDGGDRVDLPPVPEGEVNSTEQLSPSYSQLYSSLLRDLSTIMFRRDDSADTVLLDIPRLRKFYTQHDERDPTAHLTLIPGTSFSQEGDDTQSESTAESVAEQPPHHPPDSKTVLTATVAPTSPPAPPTSLGAQQRWVKKHLLQRPPSSFAASQPGNTQELAPIGADGNTEETEMEREARLLVSEAVQTEMSSLSWAKEGPPADGGSSGLREAWLARCAEEAEQYEKETLRLETVVAQRAAWRQASLRRLREEVEGLSAEAAEGRPFVQKCAILQSRLADLRRESELMQAEESKLLAQLRIQRKSPAKDESGRRGGAARKGYESDGEVPSPAPRPPVATPPGNLHHFMTAGPAAATATVGERADDLPDVSTIHKPHLLTSVTRGTRDVDPAESPAVDSAAVVRRNDAPAQSEEAEHVVAQLSFNTSSLAAAHDGDDRAFFFSPALRSSVENAITQRSGRGHADNRGDGSRIDSPGLSPRTSASQRHSSIRVMGVRHNGQGRWHDDPRYSEDQVQGDRPVPERRWPWRSATQSGSGDGVRQDRARAPLSERLREMSSEAVRRVRASAASDSLNERTLAGWQGDDTHERSRLLSTIQQLRTRIGQERERQ